MIVCLLTLVLRILHKSVCRSGGPDIASAALRFILEYAATNTAGMPSFKSPPLSDPFRFIVCQLSDQSNLLNGAELVKEGHAFFETEKFINDRLQKSPPLVPVLSHMNQTTPTLLMYLRSSIPL
jgi:hypothetical protein